LGRGSNPLPSDYGTDDSNRSDGLVDPEEVVGAYREAGYDFI
jgi:hypothetical protein